MTLSAVKIFHNPYCSKSRQSLALLKENGVQFDIIHYLETPPSPGELRNILDMLGLSARELIRTNEAAYRENNLDDSQLDDAQLIDAMSANPILIERPIVVANGRAIIGRPPQHVLSILST